MTTVDMPPRPTEKPPTVDVPIDQASMDLTGFEVLAIEKHFGKKFEDCGGTELVIGLVWAYECRAAGKAVSWTIPMNMRVADLYGYFAEPPTMADDEDDPVGKGSSTGTPERAS